VRYDRHLQRLQTMLAKPSFAGRLRVLHLHWYGVRTLPCMDLGHLTQLEELSTSCELPQGFRLPHSCSDWC
jgi:hypothetical protein